MDIAQQCTHAANTHAAIMWSTYIQVSLSSCLRRYVDSKIMVTVFRSIDKPVYASIDTSVKTSILNKLILVKRTLK